MSPEIESQEESVRETVLDVFERTARRYADRPALRSKHHGEWTTASWGEYREMVDRAAAIFGSADVGVMETDL